MSDSEDDESQFLSDNEGAVGAKPDLEIESTIDGSNGQSEIRLKVVLCAFKWRIKNFLDCKLKTGVKLASPVFTFETSGLTRWRLELYPKGKDQSCQYYISVYLQSITNRARNTATDFTISLLDANKLRHRTVSFNNVKFKNSTHGNDKFIRRSSLQRKRHVLMPEDTLTLICEITEIVREKVIFSERNVNRTDASELASETKPLSKDWIRIRRRMADTGDGNNPENRSERGLSLESFPPSTSQAAEVALRPTSGERTSVRCQTDLDVVEVSPPDEDSEDVRHRLSADLTSLLHEGKLSDVILKSDGKEIRAHKAILSARSSVFSSMFEHEMRENLENCVDISDVSYETLQLFVSYIYSGRIGDLTAESAMGLLTASDKYAVAELGRICSQFLKRNLTIYNSLEVLVLSDQHGEGCLKEAAMDFTCLHFAEVSANPDWRSKLKERPHLAAELLIALSIKTK